VLWGGLARYQPLPDYVHNSIVLIAFASEAYQSEIFGNN